MGAGKMACVGPKEPLSNRVPPMAPYGSGRCLTAMHGRVARHLKTHEMVAPPFAGYASGMRL